MKNDAIGLFDLPWNDVLVPKIMPYLEPSDWLNFRSACKQSNQLVSHYFKFMRNLDLSAQKSFPKGVWKILVEESNHLRVLKLPNSTCCDEQSIKELSRNNPHICHVDLSNNVHLRQGCIQPILVNCKKLEIIILKNSPWVTVGSLEAMSYHCPKRIRIADFSGCLSINEASLIHFVKHQPKLLSLSLGTLACVRDETLFSISQSCHQLLHLDVTRCHRVTDKGIQMIGEYCRNLRVLRVEGCGEVSERSLLKLRRRRIQVDKLQFPHYLMYKKNELPCPKVQH